MVESRASDILAGDSVDRAFRMILADGRRILDVDQERSAKALWGKVFARVQERVLLDAVETWLVEHARGRPSVGEVLSQIRALAPAASEGNRSSSSDDDRSGELRWAVNVMEAYDRNREWRERLSRVNYQHTLESAQFALRKRGYSAWQDAKSHLEPGWAPTVATEVIL